MDYSKLVNQTLYELNLRIAQPLSMIKDDKWSSYGFSNQILKVLLDISLSAYHLISKGVGSAGRAWDGTGEMVCPAD